MNELLEEKVVSLSDRRAFYVLFKLLFISSNALDCVWWQKLNCQVFEVIVEKVFQVFHFYRPTQASSINVQQSKMKC